MNPLDQLLSAVSVNWAVATPLHAGGRWALHFVGRLDLRVEIVVRGRVHITVGDEGFWAEQGDCYVGEASTASPRCCCSRSCGTTR